MPQEKKDISESDKTTHRAGHHPAIRALKWVSVIIILILAVTAAIISVAVWTLTPERLTPIVEKYGSEYIEGRIKARRVELTFWRSFPRLNIEVSGLEIVSDAFSRLTPDERRLLPPDADTLLTVETFSGGISIPLAVNGKFALYDIDIKGAKANIVRYSENLANYSLIPPSEEKEEETVLPDISINHFLLHGETPVRYFSLPDSTDATISLHQTSIADAAPLYEIRINGTGSAEMAEKKWFENLDFGINGKVGWSPRKPDIVSIEDMDLTAGKVTVRLDAVVDFTEALTLKEFRLKASKVEISDIISLIPPSAGGELHKIQTTLAADLDVTLNGPFRPLDGEWPTVSAHLEIPRGTLVYDRLNLNSVRLSATATLEGKNPDASRIILDRLSLTGRAATLDISGSATSLFSDPVADISFCGGMDFSLLPQRLTDRLPFAISGRMNANTHIRLRQSYLTRENFHRINASGSMDLNSFTLVMRDSTGSAYTRHSRLEFGTNDRITLRAASAADSSATASSAAAVADSLLKVSLTIDTASVVAEGIRMEGKNLRAGAAMKNVAASADTTTITPLGFSIRGERLTVTAPADSMTLRLRDASVGGALSRFNGEGKRPLLRFGLQAARISYRDTYNRAYLRDAHVTLTGHTKARPVMSRRVGAAYDSLLALYPGLRRDSVLKLARAEVRASRVRRADTIRKAAGNSVREHDIDMQVDGSIRSLLQWWNASGTVTAARGALFTPYFPVRNRISDFDVRFNTDSVVINSTRYRTGQSDFTLSGVVSNISRAVTSRRGAPLKAEFRITSDTLNINQIAKAIFAGSAFSARVSKGAEVSIKNTDNDEELQKSIEENASPDDKLAFIVPSNLEASLDLTAANVLYADIWAKRLTGNISVAEGRVTLQRFAAFTDLGSLDLTALYSAPDFDNLNFAGGMVIRNLDLKRFLHMLPQIDSIMPLLRDVEGIITADIAMTTELDSLMDLRFHTLDLAMRLHGDSLVILDSETFRTASKLLRFKQKNRNMIDSMSVELAIHDSRLDLYPFVFDFDRYRLGVSGGNTFAGDFDYHVAVLKSPLPFRFGINITGHDHKLKIRLGKARFNENAVASSHGLTDTVRINLLHEIESVFRFGVDNGQRKQLILTQPEITPAEFAEGDNFSRADSLLMIKEGVIEAPPGYLEAIEAEKRAAAALEKKKKRRRFLGIF